MNLNHLIIPITIAVILILILVLIACGYVKAPPDQAYIISGLVSRTDDGRYQDGTICSDK